MFVYQMALKSNPPKSLEEGVQDSLKALKENKLAPWRNMVSTQDTNVKELAVKAIAYCNSVVSLGGNASHAAYYLKTLGFGVNFDAATGKIAVNSAPKIDLGFSGGVTKSMASLEDLAKVLAKYAPDIYMLAVIPSRTASVSREPKESDKYLLTQSEQEKINKTLEPYTAKGQSPESTVNKVNKTQEQNKDPQKKKKPPQASARTSQSGEEHAADVEAALRQSNV